MSTKPIKQDEPTSGSEARSPTAPIRRTGGARVEVDFGRVPPPPTAGFANRAAIVSNEDFLEFVFWEQTEKTIAVPVARFYVSYVDVVQSLWAQWQPFAEELRKGVPSRLGPTKVGEVVSARPEGTAPLVNVLPMARHGQQATISCYFISPRALHLQNESAQPRIEVEPYFSVAMPVVLLIGVVDEVGSRIASIKQLVSEVSE